MEQGRILVIDELDNSLHFKLTRGIISLFNNELNQTAQLICTGHDITLLDCQRLFRKEQIWFTHKDKISTYLYSLSDFISERARVRDTSDLIEKYKSGVFGALPEPDLFQSLLTGFVSVIIGGGGKMAKLPPIGANLHKVCIICEGNEDYAYMDRLLRLNVWNPIYDFQQINAKSGSNIFTRYQDAYNNDRYEIILVFCDTDKASHKQYMRLKQKLNTFHRSKRTAADKIIIFSNPCTMQIVLRHFEDVSLKN